MKKISLLTALLFFIALVILEAYVQSDAFSARIRPLVMEPLTNLLGPDVHIGKIKASLMPLYVEVRDASLVDGQGRDAVSVRKIRGYINPFPLLVNKISLPSIVMVEPRLRIERRKNGDMNVARILEQLKSGFSRTKAAGPSRYRLHLRGITVKRGRISFNDQMTSSTVAVSDLGMNARIGLSDMSMRLLIKSAEITAAAAAYPEVSLHLSGSLRSGISGVHIDSLALTSDDSLVSAAGSIGPLPGGRLDLKFTSSVGPRVLGKYADVIRRIRGQESQGPFLDIAAEVKGTIADPIVNGRLALQGLAIKDLRLQDATVGFAYRGKTLTAIGKNWTLSRGVKHVVVDGIDASFAYRGMGIDINRFTITAGDLAARVTGRADPVSGFDAVLDLESSSGSKTLSILTGAALEGRAGIKGVLTGPLASPVFDGVLSAWPLTVRGVRFDEIGGKLRYADKRLSLFAINIHQQSSRYGLAGFVDFSGTQPVYEAQLTVAHSDVVNIVNLFYKPLPLTLSASGQLSLSGKGSAFSAGGRLDLDRGIAYGESFDKGSLSVSLTPERISFPSILLYKGSGMVKASGWIGFNKTYSAELESRFVDLSEVNHLAGLPFAGPFKLDIASSGSFSAPAVRVSLEIPAVSYYQAPFGGFGVKGEIKNAVAAVTATLSEERANLAASIELRAPYAWNVKAAINSDGIDPFVALGKKELFGRARMTVNGSMTVNGRGGDYSRLSGRVALQRLGLSVGDYRIDNEGEQGFEIASGKLSFTPMSFIGPGTTITVRGGARVMKSVDLAFMGRTKLSLLRVLYPEVEHSDGEAEVDLAVREDWNNPEVSGELRIKNGEIKVQDIPQKFTALNGKISFDREQIVADELTAEVGGGTLRVAGKAQLAGLTLRDFSTRISFDNMTTRYPEGLTSTLSGELAYDGDAAEQAFSGEVQIKRARYDKRVEWKSTLVDMTRGFYQRKKTDVKWIGDTSLNIHFFGKDNIIFQNNVAKLPLEADLFLRGTVNQPHILGRVEARTGTVYFRKNDFKILHASADFFDPARMNPALDIQAETRVREYQIRLSVSGTADRATVTMISDPSLSDINILSLLALGKTSEEITGKESGVGVGEAASFATGQFQDIFERRARSLTGLDRFQVDPYVGKGDTAVPRLTVGKEVVRDKLYVTYSSNVGATTPEQIFRIEYILNKNFSLLGERNEIGNIGADVKFRFEFK